MIEDADKIAKALNASMDAYAGVDSAAEQTMHAIGTGTDPAVDVADG